MSVVNVKVAHIRPEYNNLKEWMDDPNNVYIGRSGIVFIDGERYPKTPSIWSNPFKIGKDGTREEVINKYETYIRKKMDNTDVYTKIELMKLKDKKLGCWCHPEKCHGDVLLKLIDEITE